MAYIELQGVTKSFATREGGVTPILGGVELEIEEGEFVSLIGHSGCGKSTVLNLTAGLLPLEGGSIRVAGQPVRGPGPDRMVAFQNHSLLPWLTMRENIALAVDAVHRRKPAAERRAMVEAHLQMVYLQAAAERRPHQVSGGMKQRCGLARAFATKPKVLLLDEPFGALDALTRANLQDALLRLWEKERVTVMMVTHDVDEALLLSDRVVMMSNGPSARVAEILRVDLPRPRSRLEVVEQPTYYRQRGELIYFLNKCKRSKAAAARPAAPPAPAATAPRPVAGGLEKPEITVGFVPVIDCAPFAVAAAEGFFAREELRVTLAREPSWKAVSDGVREGRLDASQMVVGMPFAETLGALGRPPLPVCTALVLSRGGNAVTLGNRLRAAQVSDRETLRRYTQQRRARGEAPPVLGVVHPASMHNLLLRAWLAAGGIDPERDVSLAVIPPPQMVANLEQGNLAGYCVGEPWNTRAVQEGLGFMVATSAQLWARHAEKVLGVSAAWAERHPRTLAALVRALLSACALCDDPEYRTRRLPELLADPDHVGGLPDDFRPALGGVLERGAGATGTVGSGDHLADFVVFSRGGANLLRDGEALWILAQLARWNLAPFPADPAAVLARVQLEGPLREAAAAVGVTLGAHDLGPLQVADEPAFDPRRPADYLAAVSLRREAPPARTKEGVGPTGADSYGAPSSAG